MSALIVIPARGGSKGIPRKNLRLLAGRPLLAYPIAAARAARCGSTVVVSTEDAEIGEYAKTCGAQVLWRPPELSDDLVALDPVVLDAALRSGGAAEAIVTLQPTSPFVTGADIDTAYETLIGSDANVVFTVTDDTHLTWGFEGNALVPLYAGRVNRQQLPRRLRETGGVVCTRRATLLAHKTRFVPPYAVLEIDAARAIDIDDRFDWACAEATLGLRSVTIVALGVARVARQLTLAAGLTKHEIAFVLDAGDEAGRREAERQNFPVRMVAGFTPETILPHAGDVVAIDLEDENPSLVGALRRSGFSVLVFGTGEGAAAGGSFPVPPPEATKDELLRLLPRLAAAIESSPRRLH